MTNKIEIEEFNVCVDLNEVFFIGITMCENKDFQVKFYFKNGGSSRVTFMSFYEAKKYYDLVKEKWLKI